METGFRMIDIHNHILPGIDDGPALVEESIQMAKLAHEEGISHIVATPHSGTVPCFTEVGRVRHSAVELNEILKLHGIGITVLAGMEIRVAPGIVDALEQNCLLTLNGTRYVMLELHPLQTLAGFQNLIVSLWVAGYRSILAHPEKNSAIQNEPDHFLHIFRLVPHGSLLVQITADSLTGGAGLKALETARRLLETRAVHFLASDAHSASSRPPKLKDALAVAGALVGQEYARMLVQEWPLAVIRGDVFTPPPIIDRTDKKWWSFLRWF